jgi:hypothetical protein
MDYLSALCCKEIGLLIDFTNAADPAINTHLGMELKVKEPLKMNTLPTKH